MSQRDVDVPSPTDSRQPVDAELSRWSRIYAGERYYYGEEPGPVARRALRYHAPYAGPSPTALDAGCGEGQDLAFLAERGYRATGIDFTADGARKARLLLESRGLQAEVHQQDLREVDTSRTYDLVLAVNSLQFMGEDAPSCLDRLAGTVAPGGVLGISLFAREGAGAEFSGTIWFTTLPELLQRFRGWQPLEAANLWQWNPANNQPQAFVTLIARNAPPAGGPLRIE